MMAQMPTTKFKYFKEMLKIKWMFNWSKPNPDKKIKSCSPLQPSAQICACYNQDDRKSNHLQSCRYSWTTKKLKYLWVGCSIKCFFGGEGGGEEGQ